MRTIRIRPAFATRLGAAAAALILTFAATACDTDSLLEVDIPGRVPDEVLDDPALARTLVNSVIADLECAWTDYTGGAAVMSDEYIAASGNLLNKQWASRQISSSNNDHAFGACAGSYGSFTPLHTARFQAEDVFNRLEVFGDQAVPQRVLFQATVRAYGAYAILALGEGFCEMTIDGGPIQTRAQTLQLAESKFNEAITLATQVNNADILNMARLGRARVRLDLENFAGARADAAAVPTGYQKDATRDVSATRRWNLHHELVNSRTGPKHASIADNFRDLRFKGVVDPRVNAQTTNALSFDFVTVHYFHNKTTGRETSVPIASYKEAQLIVAEAAARSGDLATARTILNQRHTLANLPLYDAADLPAQADVIRAVIEERKRELFVEGGWRLNDMLRFRGTPYQIPFRGEAGSIHPNGIDQTRQAYGTETCLPLPDSERLASSGD
ncbi:MAG: RagB/SusD family nutrient uptake outer membrane protein [Longimicrobiales bacterium]